MDVKNNQNKGGSFLLFLLIFVGIPFFIVKSCTAAPKQITQMVEQSIHDDDLAQKINSVVEKKSYGSEPVASVSGNYTKSSDGVYKLTAPVMDTAGVLSGQQYSELDSYLRNLSRNTSVQIVVLTVNSLNGESIESYSMKHAEAWQLGKKGVDNGALLVVAMEEHDVRIETGYGTEGVLTDAKCARILRNVIIPEFKKGNYGEGIILGVKNMAGVITSDSSLVSESVMEETEDEELTAEDFVLALIGIVFIIIVSTIIRLIRPRRRRSFFPFLFMGPYYGGHSSGHSGYSSHSSHSSHSSFGGFSGGGGSFGGGGASGHW